MGNSFISTEEFLNRSMASESYAGLSEFISLWKSSETLRLRIQQIVKSSGNHTANVELIESDTPRRNAGKQSEARNEAAMKLLEKGLLSAPEIEGYLAQSYGGLTRKELLVLLEQYKAGKRSLGTYMLIRAWKKHGSNSSKSPDIRLKQLTLDFFEQAIADNRTDFFKEIAETLQFLKDEEYRDNGQWNHDPSQWWQFHLLLYILEHPKEKYAMRELVRHFEQEVGANEMPSTKTLRKFCREHGIALDSKPGAPKKAKADSKS